MSPRQRQALLLVYDALTLTGVSPSLKELAACMGTTHGAACRLVQALEAAGYLHRVGGPNSSRSLEVLRLPGKGLLAEEIAWCQANPERVRAMMQLTRAPAEPEAASLQ